MAEQTSPIAEEVDARTPAKDDGPAARVVGVRFLDSGRTFYFDPGNIDMDVGDWVVVELDNGQEAGRVVIAPRQVRLNLLQVELKLIERQLNEFDVEQMERLQTEAARAVETFEVKIGERGLPMNPISAKYNFDGSHLTLTFSAPERLDVRDLVRELTSSFGCRVELKQVGPPDEARLLGGLGRYGRSHSRLGHENERYKQLKAAMPRLGQQVETPQGPGVVTSLQILKELVTVRLDENNTSHVFASADVGYPRPETPP